MLPPISIVCTAYNSASYIAYNLSCIASNIRECDQLVLVDDCSTDSTLTEITKFADSFLDNFDILVLRTESNFGGPARSRNLGIQAAIHDWIMFIDADDVLRTPVSEPLNIVMKHTLDACSFDFSRGISTVNSSYVQTYKIPRWVQAYKNQFNLSGSIFNRNVLIQLKGFSELVDCIAVEDYVLWTTMLNKGFRIARSSLSVCEYILVKDSISRNKMKMILLTMRARKIFKWNKFCLYERTVAPALFLIYYFFGRAFWRPFYS